jgi:hypothetical protein
MLLGYADPPYVERGYLYREKTETDHVELIERLTAFDGWALSAGSHLKSLRVIVPLLPDDVIPCSWVKPGGSPAKLRPNVANTWEIVFVKPARPPAYPVDNWLSAVQHLPVKQPKFAAGTHCDDTRGKRITRKMKGRRGRVLKSYGDRRVGSGFGRKPETFCFRLFEWLGALPTDDFHDLFPGSGAVGKAWTKWRKTKTNSLERFA